MFQGVDEKSNPEHFYSNTPKLYYKGLGSIALGSRVQFWTDSSRSNASSQKYFEAVFFGKANMPRNTVRYSSLGPCKPVASSFHPEGPS